MHLVDDDAAPLFRSEAVEHYQRGREHEGHVLEIEPRWARWASRVIVALFLSAVVFAAVVHVDRYAEGVGVVRGGRVIAVVPARYAAELKPSLPLRFELAARPLAVASVGAKIVAASEARRILGEDGALRWNRAEPAVIAEAPLHDGRLGDGVAGRVRIRVGRERLLAMLTRWSRRG